MTLVLYLQTLPTFQGLGKTCQTIAFLAWLKYRKQSTCGVLKQPLQENSPIELDNSDADTKSSPRSIIDDGHRPHIVIVPASVLTNWMREFEKFCPTMNVIKYHGSMSERQDIKNQLRAYLPKTRGALKYGTTQKRLDVVVTTYSYFSSEKSDDRSFLRKFEWDYVSIHHFIVLLNQKIQKIIWLYLLTMTACCFIDGCG
jgi:SNF2 family DNA or RNA helicase